MECSDDVEESMDETSVQDLAVQEKELGNKAYHRKDFSKAKHHYEMAIRLDPSNITFYNNMAAAFFEQGELENCIEACEKAVNVGREHGADCKHIAKALGRIANAFYRKGDLDTTLLYLNKSLAEHAAPDVARRALEIQREIKEQAKQAYINPAIALEEKNKGNEAFRKDEFALALKHYSESIKRNPNDPRVHSNRAACYTKLAEFTLALRDCEQAIRLDPGFVKAHLRKGTCFLMMKDSYSAQCAFERALELDPGCAEALDGFQKSLLVEEDPESVQRRAMGNPEIQNIMSDVVMQHILEQIESDPQAIHEHLKNPTIAANIEKLIQAGLLQIT